MWLVVCCLWSVQAPPPCTGVHLVAQVYSEVYFYFFIYQIFKVQLLLRSSGGLTSTPTLVLFLLWRILIPVIIGRVERVETSVRGEL